MSKSQETFNKREREKQRMRKQQDKQEKMKERKNNKEKGNSLENMMAYLDENGNITSTPPDPRTKKLSFRPEDIQISTPKQEDRPQDEVRTGIVAFFNDHKGFGFINDAETRERVFVHVNELSIAIKENDKVTFEVQMSPKGPVAVNVALVKP